MEQILMEIHISDAIAEEKANGNAALEKNIAAQGLTQILLIISLVSRISILFMYIMFGSLMF
jgi:hypothetical protein